MNIFLDDERDPKYVKSMMGKCYPQDWVIARNYFDFCQLVDQNLASIKLVSFDHDIASYDKSGKEWTGKDAADYLINKCLDTGHKFPSWFVHTSNTSGRPNIIGAILNFLKYIEGQKIDWRYYNSGIINGEII
jgi:hypothetical protein